MFCRKCGYVLNGLEGPCPECGTSFDRNDPSTWKAAGPSSRSLAGGLATLLALTHAIIIIGGGHGIAPAGLLYVMVFGLSYGEGDWSQVFVMTGVCGMLSLVVVLFLASARARRVGAGVALLLLAVATGYLVWKSEVREFTAVTATPFAAAWLYAFWRVGFRWPRR